MEWPSSESDAESNIVIKSKDRLKALPNELFEVVLTYLDLNSIRRLRLTSTQYADKCLCPAFKRYYGHQQTDLTPASLQRLFQLTTHPILGPTITDLTIPAVFYDPGSCIATIRSLKRHGSLPSSAPPSLSQQRAQQLLESTERLSWIISRRQEQQGQFIDDLVSSLAQVLENMGSLSSLRLTTRIVRDRARRDQSAAPGNMNWNALWADCHRLFKIVAMAMTSSKVSVDTLSVFEECFGKVQSKAITELATDLTTRGFSAATGAKIKNLNLSFSTATPVPGSDIVFTQDGSMDYRGARRLPIESIAARTPDDFLGVAAFLKQTPNLESLSLYMYNTLKGPPWAYDRVFVHISKEVCLSGLRRLFLRGVRTTHDALLLFLRNHPDLTDLDLREIHMSGGSWASILKHFQSMHKLSRLHLENLWSGAKNPLNLKPANPVFDDSKRGHGYSYPTKNGSLVHTRDIGAEELRQEGGLSFVKITGRSRGKGSKALMSWMTDRRREYGPPE